MKLSPEEQSLLEYLHQHLPDFVSRPLLQERIHAVWLAGKASAKRKKVEHTDEEKAWFKSFMDAWCLEFQNCTGQGYKPAGADFQAIYTLRDMDKSVDNLIALARRAWASKYYAGKAGSIHKFSMNYNDLVMVLRPEHKESREMRQEVVIPSRVIGGGNAGTQRPGTQDAEPANPDTLPGWLK